MELLPLTAISPVDGRYHHQVKHLNDYFSEYALIKYRVLVEVEYFIALCEIPLAELNKADATKFDALRKIYLNFNADFADEIKETEKTTNHDVKAVEYFLKKKIGEAGMEAASPLSCSIQRGGISNMAVSFVQLLSPRPRLSKP